MGKGRSIWSIADMKKHFYQYSKFTNKKIAFLERWLIVITVVVVVVIAYLIVG